MLTAPEEEAEGQGWFPANVRMETRQPTLNCFALGRVHCEPVRA